LVIILNRLFESGENVRLTVIGNRQSHFIALYYIRGCSDV